MAPGSSLAERPENQRILALLEALDVELLTREECWLGGGAAVGLRCGEFRLSRYVDFLCSSVAGYRALRERVFDRGAAGLFREPVVLARELRADRYGVRFAVLADGAPLKIEFVREGRVDVHGLTDAGLPVSRLCDEDLVVEKLLANEDRHLDDASLGRDAIDLVLL